MSSDVETVRRAALQLSAEARAALAAELIQSLDEADEVAEDIEAAGAERSDVLEPIDEWPEEFLECLGSIAGGIPRPKGQPITRLRDPFER